jgi:hypothetical protein
MFQKISGSFQKANKQGGGIYNDILRFEKGKDYIVRLLPYRENLDNTIHSYSYRGFVSKSTGKYVEAIDPTDTPNPIAAYSTTLTNQLRPLKLDKEDPRMVDARKLWAKRSWLINCYVISDPTNPDNEGTVKILKMGAQLHDIVDEHIEGERAEEFGWRCFDPSANGCNFKIKVVDNGGGYPKYDKSYFMSPSEIDGVTGNDERIEEIFDSCFDLTTIFPVKTEEELQDFLDTHFKGEVAESAPASFGDIDSILDSEDDDGQEEDEQEEPEPVKKKTVSKKTETKKKEVVEDEDDIDDLIANL